MKKILILPPNENWICDKFAREFYVHHQENVVTSINDSEIVWLLASWAWDQIPKRYLIQRKVLTTIHHIVPDKFDIIAKRDFFSRDDITDIYHVPCLQTKKQIDSLTDKPIIVQPFWVNQNLWYPLSNNKLKVEFRKKHNIPFDAFVIGSFQRDTEGYDLKTPKFEKGPDLFCDAVEKYREKYEEVFVVLAGWRRQYVMKRLEYAGIKYVYFELPDYSVLKELYHCLDLYIVASRYEGGPMAIVECAAMKVPIISHNVGLATTILSRESIGDDLINLKPNVDRAFKKVAQYYIPNGFKPFEEIFETFSQGI